ncbi:MAG: multiheme c-type cytochrome [Acidobacteriota bacterium]
MSDPTSKPQSPSPAAPKRRYRDAIGPRLQKVLFVVFGLFALIAINSTYLVGVSILEAATGKTYQNWFYMNMFLVHLVLGLLIIVPVIVFGIAHMRNTYNRRNRRAVKVGYALFVTALILLGSGIVLTRLEGVIVVKDPTVRSVAYWLHVATPVVAAWLFVLHRLSGKRIKWEVGRRWAYVAAVFGGLMLLWQAQDPRDWGAAGPESGEQYFFPSLARTATGDFIPERVLMNDQYCAECHEDSHSSWADSVHRWSSFNNPPYRFSVINTRNKAKARDDTVAAARFCAGCHDPVPFFSGQFDDPNYHDNLEDKPSAMAGITCTACHAITHVNSVRGNSDYTIEEPVHYPFAFSENETLAWVNRQLVKAKPEFHKRTFLKPLHTTPEFCGSCHKVHLPEELNKYKWLRGQNHFDTYHLSGVSGHGVTSFYYPKKAEHNCNGCHMQLMPSNQFGARDMDGDGQLDVHNHQFPSANTAIPHLVGRSQEAIEAHRDFNEGVMRVDIFAVKEGGTIDADPIAPLRPEVPELVPGQDYLFEVVVRTVKMGHPFTQGTADSNQVWLDLQVTDGTGRVIGRSGGMTEEEHRVDPWSHFLNAYVLDREGKRIDRRNAEDIFVALYNHQIPPGAADSVHYRLNLPEDAVAPITVEARLQFRKFDTTYMALVHEDLGETLNWPRAGEPYVNDLPILTLADDRVHFPVAGGPPVAPQAPPVKPELEWQRWNDYGIGLLRKGGKSKGELRQAEDAFSRVEALGRPDGPLNLARVYIAQGTVQDKAIDALGRAASFDPPAYPWSVAWFTGIVNKQNGFLDEAIANFRSIVEIDDAMTRERGFDFSQDYRLLNELGQTLFERAKQERGDARRPRREELLRESMDLFQRALLLDPENATAHYNLDLIFKQLRDKEKAAWHLAEYRKYKVDDNARDRAVAIARANDPAANHAAEAIVIYDLQRDGAPELGEDALPRGGRRAGPFELRVQDGGAPPPKEEPPPIVADGAGDSEALRPVTTFAELRPGRGSR